MKITSSPRKRGGETEYGIFPNVNRSKQKRKHFKRLSYDSWARTHLEKVNKDTHRVRAHWNDVNRKTIGSAYGRWCVCFANREKWKLTHTWTQSKGIQVIVLSFSSNHFWFLFLFAAASTICLLLFLVALHRIFVYNCMLWALATDSCEKSQRASVMLRETATSHLNKKLHTFAPKASIMRLTNLNSFLLSNIICLIPTFHTPPLLNCYYCSALLKSSWVCITINHMEMHQKQPTSGWKNKKKKKPHSEILILNSMIQRAINHISSHSYFTWIRGNLTRIQFVCFFASSFYYNLLLTLRDLIFFLFVLILICYV